MTHPLRRIPVGALCLLLAAPAARAQLSLSNGQHTLDIGGYLAAYYNERDYKPGVTSFKKNRFALRNARVNLAGRVGARYEYHLQVDFAALAGQVDPENPPILDANFTYHAPAYLNLTVGYDKVPYSRASLMPFVYSPYWQRPEIARGGVFGRRDVGVTLSKALWQQRVNLYAGAYTGLAEASLLGDNDRGGKLEYVGRADVAWPARYRYRDIDVDHVPIPMMAVGINARYADKRTTSGTDYALTTVDGKRTVVGCDVSAQYQGLSAQVEAHQLRVTPSIDNPAEVQRLYRKPTNHFLAGGYVAQLSYYVKPVRLIVSGRYEDLNLNDLAPGRNRRWTAAAAYRLNGWNSMIKAQYTKQLEEEPGLNDLNYTAQWRVGWQLLFQ